MFVKCDVSQEVDGQVAVAAALKLGNLVGLVGLVGSAGIAPAEKTMGKNDPHALAAFSDAVPVNLIGGRPNQDGREELRTTGRVLACWPTERRMNSRP